MMAAIPNTRRFLQNQDRRFFLGSLASLGLTTKTRNSERSEPVYRFLTPECEVRMSVQYFELLPSSFQNANCYRPSYGRSRVRDYTYIVVLIRLKSRASVA